MKKKLLAICLVIALAATAVIGGTLAYFTDEEEATNTFTVGNVDIELTEPSWDSDENGDTYPGQELPKDPTVENTGTNPCYVRIIVEWDETLGELEYGELGEGWSEDEDGVFYYSDVLEPGDKTTALFAYIKVPADLTNDDSGDYSVNVKAEAVQSQGKPEDTTIPDWFDTCMG